MQELDNKVAAETRTEFGKGFARRLRAAGKVPAVVYGHGAEIQHIALPAHQVGLLLRKKNAILDLHIDGTKSQLALVKDVQKDPVHQIIEHIDLVVVVKGEKVQVEVPIHVTGTALSGTILELDVKAVLVEAEAMHIPENIEVSVEGAVAGTKIHLSDLQMPAGVSFLGDPEGLIVHVHVPHAKDSGESGEELAGELAEEAAHAEHKEELHQEQHDAEKAAAEADAELSGANDEAEKVVE